MKKLAFEESLRAVGVLAHKCEHPFHLVYFGALGLGYHAYKFVALGCFVLGCLAVFIYIKPKERPEQ